MKIGSQQVEKLTAQDHNGALKLIKMKNLFLSMMFLIVTSFSFANIFANKTDLVSEDLKFSCVPATLSCGITGWACGNSTLEIIENAQAADEALCP